MKEIMRESIFIQEIDYQKIKEQMNKNDDYFTLKELITYCKIEEKLLNSVKLM